MGIGVNTNVNIRVVAPKNGETVLSRGELSFMGEYKIVRRAELSDESPIDGGVGGKDWKGAKRRQDLHGR